jgi:hypothetical protein
MGSMFSSTSESVHSSGYYDQYARTRDATQTFAASRPAADTVQSAAQMWWKNPRVVDIMRRRDEQTPNKQHVHNIDSPVHQHS